MGGRGVYELLYEYAESFHAAVALAAFGIPTLAPRLTDTPLWIAHGVEDSIVPVERADDMAAVLPHARYQRLTGVGHNCAEACFSDPTLWQWLKQQ
jgi:pimeloyl-ACP methyl ester carboxylesterase